MNKILLAAALFLASALPSTSPAEAATKTSTAPLPTTVRATLPVGATSFLYQSLPIGPNGAQMLVHIWGVTRPNSADSNNRYNRFASSPFCVDIFAPALDAKKHSSWHLVSSAAYLDNDAPLQIVPHWLNPAKKEGPVLDIISSNGAPGISTRHLLLAWKNGFEEGEEAPTPQIFWSGGAGGGLVALNFDDADEKGTMHVVAVDTYDGKVRSTTVYRWDGERFAAAVSAKPK